MLIQGSHTIRDRCTDKLLINIEKKTSIFIILMSFIFYYMMYLDFMDVILVNSSALNDQGKINLLRRLRTIHDFSSSRTMLKLRSRKMGVSLRFNKGEYIISVIYHAATRTFLWQRDKTQPETESLCSSRKKSGTHRLSCVWSGDIWWSFF